MSGAASRLQEQNDTANLAAHFNEFYLQITSPAISQIGNYRIIREIGEGAFGKVYLAEHILLHSQVVLKCGLLEDPNIVREIYYHKQLRHRHIVRLYEVIKTESHLWMVLEYCEGNELYYHIYEKRRLDMAACKSLFYQIVEAIRYVHSLNLSHRDLKLENILMADADKSLIKLTDFGFVREFNPYKRTLLSTMCGTTSYMAPEVLKNEKYSGFAIDIWSMGVILYAMVYGQLPFDEDDETTTRIKILNNEPKYQDFAPRDVNLLLKQMLSKDPSQRPSVSEILNSSFLIDVTNQKLQRRSSSITDTDSIVSINQYFNVHTTPFQSRMERDLLKKLKKVNLDIESLVSAKLSGQANALTAFYDLALNSEFEKQRRRQVRRKRYYEAKNQLKRSKKRVKSVLSLSDQMTEGQPLEKILTSLSITSNKNDLSPSAPNMTRRSSDNITRNAPGFTHRVSYSKRIGANGIPDSLNANAISAPLERSVSFYTDDHKNSNPLFETDLAPKAKSKQIFEKLQFWRKSKPKDSGAGSLDASSSLSRNSSNSASHGNQSGVLEINMSHSPLQNSSDLIPCKANIDRSTKETYSNLEPKRSKSEDSRADDGRNCEILLPDEGDSLAKRPRPESVLSQMSQFSQTSHLYTMSESELDMMEGTDLEDEFYDEDGAYDSSMSVSQQDSGQRPSSFVSSRSKRRPPNFRLPSDTSILSTSTNATRRKLPLSQVSSNSSDDSSGIIKMAERIEDGANGPGSLTRPISPRYEYGRVGSARAARSLSLTKQTSYNAQMVAPSPTLPQKVEGYNSRPISPSFGGKGSKPNGGSKARVPSQNAEINGSVKHAVHAPKGAMKMPTIETGSWRRDSPIAVPTTNVFERKFISINEEEEDEEDEDAEHEASLTLS